MVGTRAKKEHQTERRKAAAPNSAVAAVFDAYPKRLKSRLLALRRLIFDTARTTDGVGALEEALKWGSRAI
jgi:hypothetical protein